MCVCIYSTYKLLYITYMYNSVFPSSVATAAASHHRQSITQGITTTDGSERLGGERFYFEIDEQHPHSVDTTGTCGYIPMYLYIETRIMGGVTATAVGTTNRVVVRKTRGPGKPTMDVGMLLNPKRMYV